MLYLTAPPQPRAHASTSTSWASWATWASGSSPSSFFPDSSWELRADSLPRISEWKWKWFNQAKNIRKTIKDSWLTAPWGETETNRRPCISGVLLPHRPGPGLLGQALHHVFCVPYLYIAWIKLERKWHHSINLCLVSKLENTLKSVKYLTMITNLWRMIALHRHWITQSSWAIFHFINCVRYKLSQNFEYIIWQDVFWYFPFVFCFVTRRYIIQLSNVAWDHIDLLLSAVRGECEAGWLDGGLAGLGCLMFRGQEMTWCGPGAKVVFVQCSAGGRRTSGARTTGATWWRWPPPPRPSTSPWRWSCWRRGRASARSGQSL